MKHLMSAMLLLGAFAVPGLTQDFDEDPQHGVARLSLLSGDVTVRRGDSGEDIAAELNAPLVTRDHVFTDKGSRAEIQLDWANIIRLAPDSEIRMARLADRDFRVELAAGTMTFRVLRDSNAQVEISTPTASIRPKQRGTYRITVREDYSTELTVRSGESDVLVGRDYTPLRSGQTLIVRGDPANPDRNFVGFLPQDDWDRWNESRDRDFERSDSYKYVSRDIYGADDLAGHGRWVYDPPYGWVWAPTVAANWAPYREGRWYHTDYYGWTWVSGDPWGWAPYHYGRWYQAPRHGWVWYPGDVGPRQYWRPALVSFFGWGVNVGSVNIGFGFGNVGWVPLAPYEIYRPWYGRNVNVVNVVNVSVVNTYRNARYLNGYSGVTSVIAGDFGRRRVNGNNFVFANDRDLVRAGDVRGRVPFEPTREARRLSDREVAPRTAPRRNNDRQQFVSRPDTDRAPQPRQDARQDVRQQQPQQQPRNEARAFVSQPSAPIQPARSAQPAQPTQPNRPDRAERERAPQARLETRPEPARPGVPERSTAPREDRGFGFSRGNASPNPPAVDVSPRREEARTRPPQAAAPPAANNRGFERAAEAGRRPERSEPSASRGAAEQPRVQAGRREASAAQERRPETQQSQPAPGTSNRGNLGRGRR